MQGAKQILAQVTFTHYYTPDTSSSLNVNGALWTLSIEMLLYAFLPHHGAAGAVQPVARDGHPDRHRTGLARVGGLGRRLAARALLRGQQFNLGIESLFIARQFVGAVSIFALGILARWLVVHGHIDGIYAGCPRGWGSARSWC